MAGSYDVCDELAAIVIPLPDRTVVGADTYEIAFAQAHEQRIAVAERMRRGWDEDGADPVLHLAGASAAPGPTRPKSPSPAFTSFKKTPPTR